MNTQGSILTLPRSFWDAMEQEDYRAAETIIILQMHVGTQQGAEHNHDDSFMGTEFPSFGAKRLDWEAGFVSGTITLMSLDLADPIRFVVVRFYLDFLSETIEFILFPPTDLT